MLKDRGVPLVAQNNATVVFERRWVVQEMPKYELLALLAHAYGKLRSIVSRGHGQLSMDTVVLVPMKGPDNAGRFQTRVLAELPFDGRLPCMISSSENRSSRFRLLDGAEVESFTRGVDLNQPIDIERLQETYGALPAVPRDALSEIQTAEELSTLVNSFGQAALGILRSGEEHGWFSYYFRMGHGIDVCFHSASDKQGKMAISGEIAHRALRSQADVVLLLGEVWYTPMAVTRDGAYMPPGVNPSREEAMVIYAVAKSGAQANLMIPFTTVSGEPPNRQVEIGDPEPNSLQNFGLLEPTRRAWGIGAWKGRPGASFFRRA